MRRRTHAAQSQCFILKITLDDIRPPIWRRLAVPGSITLDLLHDALNLTMGWEDYHLHEFDFGHSGDPTSQRGSIASTRRFTEDPEEPFEGEDELGVRLDALIDRPRVKFAYRYDFGDGWQHTVTVESIDPVPENHAVELTCLGGKRRCPPEDVGGIRGYADYLNAIGDKKNPEHRAMLAWRGQFDPEAFDKNAVNHDLAWLTRWSRPRTR